MQYRELLKFLIREMGYAELLNAIMMIVKEDCGVSLDWYQEKNR
jgi:hypothetical protein